MAQNCCLITNCVSWSLAGAWLELEHTRAGLVRKSLVRPPALQYNLPPRWRLIKKVLGDHIRPAQTLQHLSHWSIYWTCLLLSYSNLCWTWWCWAGGWGNNRNDIKHKFHCDPQFFTMLCSASNPPTNIWPSSGLLCRAGFSSIHILLGRNVQNILFIKA